jgi:multidrug efflux pump subunit AcrA (membrane-fusion protein)
VSGTGTLERRREMALSFRIAGVLTRMNVEAGDSVRAGQVIATIDPASLDARQQQDLRRPRARPAATSSATRPCSPRAM